MQTDNKYFDLDDILAEEVPVLVEFQQESRYNSFLDPTST
jgi:hypothetical protein